KWENANRRSTRHFLRNSLDRFLPLSYEKAPSDLNDVTAWYHEILLRKPPRPFNGQATVILSETLNRRNESMRWQKLIRGGIDLRITEGDHVTALRENIDVTIGIISACLRESICHR